MLKKSIASLILVAFLMPGPRTPEAVAQTVFRGPVRGTSVTSVIGTGINSPVPSAFPSIMPVPALGALSSPDLMVAPSLVPVAAKPVLATQLFSPQLHKDVQLSPVKGSPLAVIQSQNPSVGVAEKATALDIMFDDSVRIGAETLNVPDQSAQPVYQHSAQIPQKASSGRFWTMEMLDGFVKEPGKTLRNVPGVQDVVVGHNEALGGKLASLAIIVDSSKDIAKVKKAIEKAVPDIKRVYGVLGAPNQAIYQHSAQIVPATAKGAAVSDVSSPRKRIGKAVVKINDYLDKERTAPLSGAEINDMTAQFQYLVGLPNEVIPAELLGHLEGLAIATREIFLKGPVGRDVKALLTAAEHLRAKVVGIP